MVAIAGFGHRVDSVWIGEGDGGYSPDNNWWTDYLRLDQIVILHAGRAAVDRLSGFKHEYPDWEAGNDYKLAWKRALWLSGDDETAARFLLQWATRFAECLVEKLWPQIYKLAFALLEHDKLSGQQVNAILDQRNGGQG